VDAAAGLVVFSFNQVGADRKVFHCLRVKPNSAAVVDPRQQVAPAEFLPAFNVLCGNLQMPAELPAAFATGESGSRLIVGHFFNPACQVYHQTLP
jgi:hypothetical protein